jgi:hypothetical protein
MCNRSPDPWRLGEWECDHVYVWADDDTGVADIHAADNDVSPGRAMANARLIAAAPELLRACRVSLAIESLWMPPPDSSSEEESNVLAAMRDCLRHAVEAVDDQV